MEVVRCPEHGSLCFLKTGVRDGPNKGKSFYVCRADACGFVRATDIPVSHCLLHEDFVVELQGLLPPEGKKEYKLFFRCIRSKAEGKHWCGSIPWKDPNSKEHSITSKSKDASKPCHYPSNHQRNPFKVLDKNQEPSLWKQFIRGEGEEEIADKKKRENQLFEQEKEQKAESECWVEKDLPSHMFKKKQPAVPEKMHRERTEFQREAQETEGTHKRNLSEVRPEQCHGNELRKPSVSPEEQAAGEGQDTQKESALPREKETKFLPLNVHAVSKPQEGRPSKKHPKTREPRGSRAEAGSGTLTIPVGPHPQTSRASSEAPKGPAARSAPPAAGPSWGEGREAATSSEDSEEERAVFASSKPKDPPRLDLALESQKETLQVPDQSVEKRTSPASGVSKEVEPPEPAAQRAYLTTQLRQKKSTLASVNIEALPDKGQKLLQQIQGLEDALSALALCPEQEPDVKNGTQAPQQSRPIRATTDPPHSGPPPALQGQALWPPAAGQVPAAASAQGHEGHTNHNHLHAVWKVTSEAIDELHRSLESCPGETAVAEDPAGLTVPLLLHQKQALAWLLWRESQKPQGGILADDMGLGKTLTMIALILTQKNQEENKEKVKNSVAWLSKDDSSDFTSHGTLIICPASLIHHWKKEVEKRVRNSKLRVYLYHGPNRDQHAKV